MFGSNFIMYCNKCGYVDIRHQHHTCPFCKKLLKASDRVFINKTIRYKEENEQIENDIFQRLVKGNKAFDASAYENRIQQMRQQEEEIEKYIFEPSESEIKAAIEQTKIIQETFNDKRKIRCKLPIDKLQLEDNIHQEGNLFISENNEIIYLELQLTDFTEDELVKYVELA